MNPVQKLNLLYKIKDRLHPLTLVLILGFVETQKRVMGPHDIQFVLDVYPSYFNEDGTEK